MIHAEIKKQKQKKTESIKGNKMSDRTIKCSFLADVGCQIGILFTFINKNLGHRRISILVLCHVQCAKGGLLGRVFGPILVRKAEKEGIPDEGLCAKAML